MTSLISINYDYCKSPILKRMVENVAIFVVSTVPVDGPASSVFVPYVYANLAEFALCNDSLSIYQNMRVNKRYTIIVC